MARTSSGVRPRSRNGKEGRGGGGGRGNANVGKTPVDGGDGGRPRRGVRRRARIRPPGPPPFREASNRDPADAVKVLLAAGANPNAKAPDGSTPLHQAVTARQVEIIRALVGGRREARRRQQGQPDAAAAGRKAGTAAAAGQQQRPGHLRPKRDTREEVIAAVRELMHLGPNDPAPVPPPQPRREEATTRRPTTRSRRPERRQEDRRQEATTRRPTTEDGREGRTQKSAMRRRAVRHAGGAMKALTSAALVFAARR